MTSFSDRNFDDLAARFKRTIYNTPKGRLRLAALEQDFIQLNLPIAQSQILDIGGGQGQFALWLAKQGGSIHLCDISAEMLALAQDMFAQENLPLQLKQGALQEVATLWPNQQFDIVLNHAVLEWLEDPLAALPLLTQMVKLNGYLSLMFYNLHGHVWRQLMNGRTHAEKSSNSRLRAEGNAPQHPLDPDQIEQALQGLGFELIRWRGIRCIYDHMHQKIRERIGEDEYSEADLKFGLLEPYRRFGRYVHFVARKIE